MNSEPICDCDFGCDCGAGDYADEHKAIFHRVQDLDMMFLNGLLFVRRESLESLPMTEHSMNDLLAIKTQTVIISEPAEHAGYYFLWDEAYTFLFMHDENCRILYRNMEGNFYYNVMANTDIGGGNKWKERALDLWEGFVDDQTQCWNAGEQDCYDKVKKRYKDDLRQLFLEFMEEQGNSGNTD